MLPETILKKKKKKKENSLGWSNSAADCTIDSRCFTRESDLHIISFISMANGQFHYFTSAPVNIQLGMWRYSHPSNKASVSVIL